MEGHRVPRHRNGTHHHGGGDGGGGESFECTSRSCAAALIADCVALCCCPCAVVNFLAFAFVKVPWAVGRRCLGAGKMNKRKTTNKKRKKRQETTKRAGGYDSDGGVVEGEERWWKEEGVLGISATEEAEGIGECVSARFEAERVWLELYQIGHLGFGRLSFTGIQPQLKGN
ncbi:hypothetical protein TIFTF001_011739 [Ficus carica]|uniref:Uncharacterized protein n=1 Tax=Ficus carica TaxID=3494 RepID=A0AA88D4H7_FICCA|nr:hypothetical protein TIFTF001_011739 [Ficus carica]